MGTGPSGIRVRKVEQVQTYLEYLEETLSSLDGDHADLLADLPKLYQLFQNLLEDPDLPPRMRPLILATMAYVVTPHDIIPDHRPDGYVDDLYLSAVVAETIERVAGGEVVRRNWESDEDLSELLDDLRIRSEDALDDGVLTEEILRFVGYDFIVGDLAR